MISNQEIGKVFEEFSEVLDLKNADRFKVAAYERAAQAISSLGESVEDIYKKGGTRALEEIPGVGKSIAEKIEEYIKSGKVRELDTIKKGLPRGEIDLLKIPGIGPKTALKLTKDLKVRNVGELKTKLAKTGSKFFKSKTLDKLLRGIEIYKGLGGRMLLSQARPIAEDLVLYLKKKSPASEAVPVGSLRRWKETVGDIDIVATSKNPAAVIDCFAKYPDFVRIINKGQKKCTALHRLGMQIDLEILPQESYGSLLQHFTGSKEHNVALRTFAREHGKSVSEHGVKIIKTGKLIKCKTEKEVYETLAMQYIEPELREDKGEIEASLKGRLPDLIKMDDIKGDMHVHSDWSDAQMKIESIASEAQKRKYDFIAISDHTVGLGIARGLSVERFIARKKEIDRVQKKFPQLKLLNSCEVNITSSGELDMPDKIMETFDIVTASVHSGFAQDEKKMTERLIRAIRNKYVNFIGHPTGRIINRRGAYSVDWERIFKECVRENVALEINASPERLDLTDSLVFAARKLGVKFVISTDAHTIGHLDNIIYGLAVARRGWCEKKDIVNTLNYSDLTRWMKG